MAWTLDASTGYGITIHDEVGIPICTVGYMANGPHALARAQLIACAPSLARALIDMTSHAEHHFPQPLLPLVSDAKKLIQQLGEMQNEKTVPGDQVPRSEGGATS